MSDVIFQNRALKTALQLYRQPILARKMTHVGLPEGIWDVLKIAAEGEDWAARSADSLGSTAREVHEACMFYLQTVVFYQNASDERLLGLTEPVNAQTLRDHKRMILKWLHPDRNHNSWESKLFLRVQMAAGRLEKSLRNPELQIAQPLRKRNGAKLMQNASNKRAERMPKTGFLQSLLEHKKASTIFVMFALAICVLLAVLAASEFRDLDFLYEAAN
jgi:hypothetical protein